ncbi:MAG: hypothetical protein MZV63_14280 [Marinilabiliales bacterium]|nr:hypothetical protein [Marinilabiliales bacterium]
MDEIRGRIDPDPSGPKIDRCFVKIPQPEAGEADIDGLPEQVEAVFGDALARRPKGGVGLRRPVAGYDVERHVRRDLAGKGVQEVEKTDVDVLGFPGPMVPQDVFDLLEGRGDDTAGAAILDGRGFSGMGVVKGQTAIGRQERLGRGVSGEPRQERKRQRGSAQAEEPPAAQKPGLRDVDVLLVHHFYSQFASIIPHIRQ